MIFYTDTCSKGRANKTTNARPFGIMGRVNKRVYSKDLDFAKRFFKLRIPIARELSSS